MKELIDRLSSRKLWIAVGAFITFMANKQYSEALMVVLTYLGVNAGVEAVQSAKMGTTSSQLAKALKTPENADFSAVDHTGKLISGREAGIDPDDEDWQDKK